MTTITRIRLLAAAAMFLGFAAAALGDASTAASADPVVDCRQNNVTVDSGIAKRKSLIDAVVLACGLRLVQFKDLGGDVQLPLTSMPLADFIELVLSDVSYQLHARDGRGELRGSLWILSDGNAIPPESELLFETTLLHGEFSDRREAVRQLRRISNEDSARLLSYALVDPDPRIRSAAEEALSATGDVDAIAVLNSSALYGSTAVRIGAVEALSEQGGDLSPEVFAGRCPTPTREFAQQRRRRSAMPALG